MKTVRKYSAGGPLVGSSLAQRNKYRSYYKKKTKELEDAIAAHKGTPKAKELVKEYNQHIKDAPPWL